MIASVVERPPAGQRFRTVDALRGIASLAVCWFHMTRSSDYFPTRGTALELSGRYGWLGVDVFFVISGFVIPWALHRSGYRLREFWRFVLRRIARLDPPYLASIGLVIGFQYLSAASPGYRGEHPHFSFAQVLSQIGYVSAFLGYPWIGIVYWSLALEFQYYLAIGLAFPLIEKLGRLRARGALLFVVALGALSFIPGERLVFRWGCLFGFGIVVYLLKSGKCGALLFSGLTLAMAVGCAFTLSPLVSCVGLCTALTIAFIEIGVRPFLWLGEISYSLYLVHVPVGGRVVNLASRWAQTTIARTGGAICGLVASLAFAWLFYRIVERPSRRLAASLNYGRQSKSARTAPRVMSRKVVSD